MYFLKETPGPKVIKPFHAQLICMEFEICINIRIVEIKFIFMLKSLKPVIYLANLTMLKCQQLLTF